ncbi:MAG: hypothetical protein ACRERU_11150 [Methylococcales bacterium]
MHYRNNEHFFRVLTHNDGIRKTLEEEPFSPSTTRDAGYLRERNDPIFEKVQREINRLVEFYTKAGTLLLVPCRRFDRFFCRVFKNPYSPH